MPDESDGQARRGDPAQWIGLRRKAGFVWLACRLAR